MLSSKLGAFRSSSIRCFSKTAISSNAHTNTAAHGHAEAHGHEHGHDSHGHDDHGHGHHEPPLAPPDHLLNPTTKNLLLYLAAGTIIYQLDSSYQSKHDGQSFFAALFPVTPKEQLDNEYEEYRNRVNSEKSFFSIFSKTLSTEQQTYYDRKVPFQVPSGPLINAEPGSLIDYNSLGVSRGHESKFKPVDN